MDNDKTVLSWQASIINKSEAKLSRKLTETEKKFIVSRGGFIALEAIEDSVESLKGREFESYLNSESNEK